MEKIPLPARILAKQQRLTVEADGNITRDRMVVIQQQEVLPVMVHDPVVREWASSQLAQQNIDAATARGVYQAMIISFFIIVFGTPAMIYLGLVYF